MCEKPTTKEHHVCGKPGCDVFQNPHFSPAIELNSISKFGKLVWEAPLLYDALWTDRYLAQGVGLRGRNEAELIDGVGYHILGGCVLTDDDVTALLISLKYPDHLIWDVWQTHKHGETVTLDDL